MPPRRCRTLGLVAVALAGSLAVAMSASGAAVPRHGLGAGISVTAATSAPKTVARPTPTPTARTTARTTPTPAASAKPAATSQPAASTNHLSQKGVASARYVWRDPGKLAALNVSWTYGWSPYVPASTKTLDAVPMIARASDATAVVARDLTKGRLAGKYTQLLGFNEPDHANQADLTPAQAIRLWPVLESTGLTLGSPAPADVDDGWLDEFMSLAATAHALVDFIALHFYLDFSNPASVDRMRASIQKVYAKYHKPIWVTEIGAIDVRSFGVAMRSAPTAAAAAAFMSASIAMFEQQASIVARYAWFTDNCWSTTQYRTSSLYDGNDTMTALGKAFSAIR